MEAKIDMIIRIMEGLSGKVHTLESQTSAENLDKKIENIVDKKLAEAREREKRERNLVFVNIKESAAAAATERKREDIAEVKKVLDKVVQLAEDEIREVFRLGQVGGNKPRLLKVVMKDKEKKYEILRKSKDLNQGINDPRKKVYVNPDYSKEQRQANKELREEFKRRVGQGEKDIKIIKGKIVKLENKGGGGERNSTSGS
jgi:hypothetical protein